MTLDAAVEEHRPLQHWLYRCDDRTPFAYAHGDHFIRYADHTRWATLSEAGLVSVRSGEVLAYLIGDVFYDTISHQPLYYEPARSPSLR